MLERLRQIVWEGNMQLPKNRLVTMTSGNVSGRDPQSGYVIIKPSGVLYEHLRPEDLVVVDIDGNVIEGNLKPSVDTSTHLYIYKHLKEVNGIVHTHSPYATSFAAVGQSIPVCLTAIADEFGRAIPCGPYASIGGEDIGCIIVEYIGESPAILLKQHGVFTIGKDVFSAVKAAVMCEDVAKTVHLAKQLGEIEEIPEKEVARAHLAYKEKYGQNKQ